MHIPLSYLLELQKETATEPEPVEENEKGGEHERGFLPLTDLKGKLGTFVKNIQKGTKWGFDEADKKLIEANIIKFKNFKANRKTRGRKGHYYKVELDKLEMVFHIHEAMDLKQ